MADFSFMASHKVSNANARLTWERLSSRDLWSWPLFWFAALVFGIFTAMMDFLRTDNGSWLWAVTYSVTLAETFLLALLVRFLVLPKIPDRFVSLTNVLAPAVIVGIKNTTVALMAFGLGLEPTSDLLSRLLGGVVMGAGIMVAWAAIVGARGSHKLALEKLAMIQSELLGSKENLDTLLADEVDRLQSKSRETVLPKIEQISQLLGDDSKTSEVVESLNDTVQNRVRPLMQDISATAKAGLRNNYPDPLQRTKLKTPPTFDIRDGIRPLLFASYMVPAGMLILFYFQSFRGGALIGLGGAVATLLIYAIFKQWLLPRRPVKKFPGYFVFYLLALAAPIPSLFLVGLMPLNRVQSIVVPAVYWVVMVIVPATIGPLLILDNERAKLEAQISGENESLAKEITLFEQKLWVFRRRWLFMLHGTVQAALTAALTRLQTFSETDPYQASLVRADLDRAAKALQEVPSDEIDFEESLEQLKTAWEGVCAINVSVDMRAERALKSQRGTAYCVNEIAKEAVGNAVRHGGATAVAIRITRPQDDLVVLEFENNGTPVSGRARKKGIGSRMLDDITLSWSLKRTGKLTTLKATLPL